MRDSITLRLGDREFAIRPLTIDQVEALETSLLDTQAPQRGGIARSRAILEIALKRDHADVDVAEIETTARELAEASKAILNLGGFVTAAGEAPAAAPDAPTGAASEAA